MTVMKIRLELGRREGYPDGDPWQGYEFIVPLTEKGQVDAHAWSKVRHACTVEQFEAGFILRKGHVRHVGQGWRFDYDHLTGHDDEIFFKLDHHPLVPGRYVSIKEPDGIFRPFKVVSVQPINAAAEVSP